MDQRPDAAWIRDPGEPAATSYTVAHLPAGVEVMLKAVELHDTDVLLVLVSPQVSEDRREQLAADIRAAWHARRAHLSRPDR